MSTLHSDKTNAYLSESMHIYIYMLAIWSLSHFQQLDFHILQKKTIKQMILADLYPKNNNAILETSKILFIYYSISSIAFLPQMILHGALHQPIPIDLPPHGGCHSMHHHSWGSQRLDVSFCFVGDIYIYVNIKGRNPSVSIQKLSENLCLSWSAFIFFILVLGTCLQDRPL